MPRTSTTRKPATAELTPSESLEGIRQWTDRHGHLPAEDEYPAAATVVRSFGSWKGGLAAAGYPLEPGHRPGPQRS